MATETAEGMSSHRRGVTVTTITTLAGVVAGVISWLLASSPSDPVGVVALGAALFVGVGAMRAVGIDVQGFSAKDVLYVAFMGFALWFVTWGILLTSSTAA
ncbi:MAG: hypothetical protein ABEJ70_08470 [Halobacteriaceae archaeon]